MQRQTNKQTLPTDDEDDRVTMTAGDYEARPVVIDGILVGFGLRGFKLRLTTASSIGSYVDCVCDYPLCII